MKFSGNKEKFESGATREVKKGRGLPALIYPGLLERLSKWLEMGAENHEARNWEQGIPSESYLNSLYRHAIAYHKGDRSEDHLAAMLFNVQGLIFNEEMIERGLLSVELDDLPSYIKEAPENMKPTLVVTHSGKGLNPLNPDPKLIDIEDIAQALSKQCRYTGHTNQFYSVAQHSVLAARWAKNDGHNATTCLAILLHDASEAYLSDISSPVKQVLSEYQKIEEKLQGAIYKKFLGGANVSTVLKDTIKKYDRKMLGLEVHYLMPKSPTSIQAFDPWLVGDAALKGDEVKQFYGHLKVTWGIEESRSAFLSEFNHLQGTKP